MVDASVPPIPGIRFRTHLCDTESCNTNSGIVETREWLVVTAQNADFCSLQWESIFFGACLEETCQKQCYISQLVVDYTQKL